MTGKAKYRVGLIAAGVAVMLISVAGYVGIHAKRSYSVLRDWRAQVRQAIDSGSTIGSAPAAKTFEASYLEAVFGSDPDLLKQLQSLIAKGIAEDPTINLGEVTAMLVTYTKAADGKVEDVAVHVLGGFEVGKRRPGFNHDGFFAVQIDRNLWNTGNSLLGLLGRDMIVFADPRLSHTHDELMESVLAGDIMPLVNTLTNRPMYFTAVFPDPKRVMPSQLRPHIQTCVFRGFLAPESGKYETLFLTKEPKSASYTLAILNDLRLAAGIALRSRFDGVVHKTAWGDQISTWWAVQLAEAVDAAVLEKQQNIVSINSTFQREMVNASLKSVERMGRDMYAMRMIRDDKLDPRLADAKMQSRKPQNYWSDQHVWGPDWPIPPRSSNAAPAAPAVTVPAPAKQN